MSSFPGSPRLLKGGHALLDPDTGAVERNLPLQYNPDTLTRSLENLEEYYRIAVTT